MDTLPSTTQLNNYSNSSWKDSDGLCHEKLESKRCYFENNNKSLDKLDFRRMGSLSQDGMMVKEKLYFDNHGQLIVGIAGDTFNEKGINLELKLLSKQNENETASEVTDETSTIDETSTSFKNKDTKLSLTKYYLTVSFRHGIKIVFLLNFVLQDVLYQLLIANG